MHIWTTGIIGHACVVHLDYQKWAGQLYLSSEYTLLTLCTCIFQVINLKYNTHRIVDKGITLFVHQHKPCGTVVREDLGDTCK